MTRLKAHQVEIIFNLSSYLLGVQSIDEGGSNPDGFDSQRRRQSQLASLTPKVSTRDIPNSSTYSPLNSTFNATRNCKNFQKKLF